MKSNFLILLLAIALFACGPGGELYDGALCIRDITTIDAQNGLKEHQNLVIKDGKITHVGHRDSLRFSSENNIIEGKGQYLIPGLWDAHVHYAYQEELAPYMSDLFLYYGITSLRDTGGEIEFMRKWKDLSVANPTTTPRLMIAGPLLDGMPNVYDGSSPGRPPLSQGLATVAQLNQYIDYLDSMGVDLLKAYEMLTPVQFKALMAKAKEKGLKVTGHIPLSMDVISAVKEGLNSIEHMRNVEMSMAVNAKDLLRQRQLMLANGKNLQGGDLRAKIHQAQRIPAIDHPGKENTRLVLEALAHYQVVQTPTIALFKIPAYKEFMSDYWQESYRLLPDDQEEKWQAQMKAVNEGPENLSRQRHYQWGMKTINQMHQAGIPLMAGTDTPIGFLTPGLSLHAEIALYVEAGLSPLEALATATTAPAAYFDMEDKLGLISPGMWADLLILDANPLDKIDNTRQIKAVIKQGNFMDRDALRKKLN